MCPSALCLSFERRCVAKHGYLAPRAAGTLMNCKGLVDVRNTVWVCLCRRDALPDFRPRLAETSPRRPNMLPNFNAAFGNTYSSAKTAPTLDSYVLKTSNA